MEDNKKTVSIIKSISYNQDEILWNILKLHVPSGKIDCDPTFSKGNFYKTIPRPKYRFDLSPQTTDTVQADCRHLPLENESIECINFDPPFVFGIHGKAEENISAKRFSIFKDFNELKNLYKEGLSEFYRILKNKGILIFKCQDYTDTKTTMTHCLVWQWAIELGFYPKDLFLLLVQNRIANNGLQQLHARKFHSYFWVFQKVKSRL